MRLSAASAILTAGDNRIAVVVEKSSGTKIIPRII